MVAVTGGGRGRLGGGGYEAKEGGGGGRVREGHWFCCCKFDTHP
jgi:hypothetical protein